jgi:putative MFS transporter
MTAQSITTPSPVTAGQVGARIERLPLTRWQVKARVIVGAVTFFDGFDQLMLAYSLPVLGPHWGLTSAQTSFLIAVGGLGMLVGALLGGWLADRVGRLKVISAALIIYAVMSLGMATFDALWLFMIFRFIQGIGLGAEIPTAASYINEIVKAKGRGKFVLLYETIFPVGLVLSAIVSSWVVPNWGYRWLFALGALPVLLVPFIHSLPESPRWLASRGRHQDAEASLLRIEQSVQRHTGEPLPPVDTSIVDDTASAGHARFSELFSVRFLRRSLMLGVIWFAAFFVNYGIASWLPTIYSKTFGVSVDTALHYTIITTVAGLVGCIVIAFLIDGIGRKACITGSMVLSALLLFTLAALGADSAIQVLLWTSGSAIFIYAINMALYVYTAELYPTRMRAMGSAWGGACARAGIVAGPFIVGFLVDTSGGLPAAFVAFGVVALVGGLTVAVFGRETKNRTLEELNQ